MLEKMGAVVVMVATCLALWWIQEMNLPVFIAVPLVIVGAMTYLVGVVFLFAEETILTSARRVETAPQVEETLEEAA